MNKNKQNGNSSFPLSDTNFIIFEETLKNAPNKIDNVFFVLSPSGDDILGPFFTWTNEGEEKNAVRHLYFHNFECSEFSKDFFTKFLEKNENGEISSFSVPINNMATNMIKKRGISWKSLVAASKMSDDWYCSMIYYIYNIIVSSSNICSVSFPSDSDFKSKLSLLLFYSDSESFSRAKPKIIEYVKSLNKGNHNLESLEKDIELILSNDLVEDLLQEMTFHPEEGEGLVRYECPRNFFEKNITEIVSEIRELKSEFSHSTSL